MKQLPFCSVYSNASNEILSEAIQQSTGELQHLDKQFVTVSAKTQLARTNMHIEKIEI